MTASDLRGRLSAAKAGQFFNICVDSIIYAERLEADLRSKGEECRHYAEKADRLESERDSWRRISERLEAENKRLRDKVATYIEDARYYHRQWKRQSELNLDAIQEIARLRERQEDDYEAAMRIKAALGRRDEEIARLRAIRDAAQHVWNTIPAEYTGPTAEAHARALNNLGAALADIESQFVDTSSQVPTERDGEGI